MRLHQFTDFLFYFTGTGPVVGVYDTRNYVQRCMIVGIPSLPLSLSFTLHINFTKRSR